MKTGLEALKGVMEVQCSDGNWNYDPYMHGMANGLILACALMEGGVWNDEPFFLQAPEKWLSDIPLQHPPLAVMADGRAI